MGGVAADAAIYTPQFVEAVIRGIKAALGIVKDKNPQAPGASQGRAIGAVLFEYARNLSNEKLEESNQPQALLPHQWDMWQPRRTYIQVV